MSPELATWLEQQNLWVQIAANRLLCNGQLSDADIAEFASIIKDPILAIEANPGTAVAAAVTAAPAELRLVSIGPVEGIDALSTRSPLAFGDKNVVVVYGYNGSGKSGYTRIISRAAGKPHAGNLKTNVFTPPPARQTCKIKFSVDGIETEEDWIPTSPIEALGTIDVFDTGSGRIYLESETEVAFLPPELSLMSDLVEACNQVEAVLSTEERRLVGALPALPNELNNTAAALGYRGISHTTSEAELNVLTAWIQENIQELETINTSLAVADPVVAAQRRRSVKRQREAIANALEHAISQLTGAELEVTRAKASDAANKRRIANEAAEALKSRSAVDGVGTDTWREMWKAAREFAIDEAFPFKAFPNVERGARCVLCHQELDEDSRERLSAFESFVSGRIQTDAAEAERDFREHLETIDARPLPEALQTSAEAGELEQRPTTSLEAIWTELELNLEPLRRGALADATYVQSEEAARLIISLRDLAASAEIEAETLTRSANPEARRNAETRKKELLARKWVSEQAAAIRAEVERLKQVHTYQQWKRQTDTRGLSRKAGELSETLVTDAYIQRFNAELAQLGAREIQVELVKTRTERGRSKHSIRLRNATTPGARILDILSEGERRIISLAAFLADVTGRNTRSPFIFDDPISSLDQTWEEKTVDRLIALSTSRQVIVFTHRLSLLGIITDKAEAFSSVYIRREPWGTGEPGEIPLDAKRPDRSLNDLKIRRLARARNALNDAGGDAYYPLAKAICSDLRVLIERLVEFILLADVVQRHRRAVNTDGKIHLLARIRPTDCALIEIMMGKYSRYEHSQSIEAPVQLPSPDEIASDIDRLVAWHTEFKDRPIPPATI